MSGPSDFPVQTIQIGNIIIFTGAPRAEDLDWDEANLLTEDNIADHVYLAPSPLSTARSSTEESFLRVKPVWRTLPFEKKRQSPIDSGEDSCEDHYPRFCSPASVSFGSWDRDDTASSELLSQFYKRSLAVHDQIPASQLGPPSPSSSSLVDESGTSFCSNESSALWSTNDPQPLTEPFPFPQHEHLNNVKDIPKAKKIQKIWPSTMSVSLIVGIMAISQPRTVKTRWGPKYIVEVMVGDDTKAGFCITFWLPGQSISDSMIGNLRKGDIVLMRNVGLNGYEGQTYGTSLRKNLTKVHILYRRKLDGVDLAGHYSVDDIFSRTPAHPQLAKTRLVSQWVFTFVGDAGNSRRSKRPRWDADMPPPHTPSPPRP
ncbi:hypothetical protein B0H63DRAFT_450855 [Podospora didyma]|uniref:Uncharacterized protein n=1 Tax=Podospora didyma TaxID=330526 RepID=A0AAE0NH99_9PEZI|nr:hypothetical protein B0H63DRAFT_450855 [Podospora didyma]